MVGRLGMAVEGSHLFGSAPFAGYAEANLLHKFLGDNQITAAETNLNQDLGGTSAEFGVVGTLAISETVSIYGEVDYGFGSTVNATGFRTEVIVNGNITSEGMLSERVSLLGFQMNLTNNGTIATKGEDSPAVAVGGSATILNNDSGVTAAEYSAAIAALGQVSLVN